MKPGFFFFNSRNFIFNLSLVFLLLSFSSVATAEQSYMDSARIQYANQIQEALYDDDFALDDSLNNYFIKKNSNDPIGYLFQAASLMAEMTDREENLFEKELKQLTDTVLFLTENQFLYLDSNDFCWYYLLRGHAYVYKSLWEARFGSRMSSARAGYNAKEEYEKGLEADSSCYDLYFGLGAFHYWKSSKAGFLRKIRIFSDDRKKGIAELLFARDSSLISKEAASNSLVWIWLEKEMYDSSIAASLELSRKYQKGKMFLWPLAESYFKAKKYEKAISVLRLLRDKLVESNGSYYNMIECDYNIYQSYIKLNKNKKARESAQMFLQYSELVPKDIQKKQKSRIKKLLKAAN